ncbi:MAG: heme biosynthesis protein HemY [Zoogloeaceae bacterium]|jgi:HemY protein|nr:heme biosynthesis protein HemY [Zoogloeaceae bacterium]
MRSLIWLLVLVILAVAASLLARNDGVVLVLLPPWRVEISLTFLVILLLLAFALAYGLIRALCFSLALPAQARAYRQKREHAEALAAMENATRLLFAGRYGHALRAAESAWRVGQFAATAALIAARAAQRMRKTEETALWLERAQAADEEKTAVAAHMIGAETALEMGDEQAALLHLQEVQRRHGRHIAALRLEMRARQGTGDVEGVLRLLRQLEKRGGMPEEAARRIRRKMHQQALMQRQANADELLAYFNALPKGERTPRLAESAARRLHRAGEDDAAAEIVENAIADLGDADDVLPDLAELYGQLTATPGRALTARIAHAEAWLAAHPRDARLLLALGRLCIRQQLWGKARNYLEASLSVAASHEAHFALACLLDTLEEPDAANRHFRLAASVGEGAPSR